MTDSSLKSYIKVSAYTWVKDVHGLFDFENMKMYRKANFILTEKELATSQNEKPLFYIEKNPITNKFLVGKAKDSTQPNGDDIYRIVRGIKAHGRQIGYEMKVNERMKIGRVKFFIKEFGDEKGRVRKIQENLIDATPPEEMQEELSQDSQTLLQKKICRYCLSEDISSDPIENTLICLCKCKGTCKYTHVVCFRHWIDNKKRGIEKLANITPSCVKFAENPYLIQR